MGKENPQYTPFLDTGDHVIVINASKLTIDPKKATDKLYHRHTGYPGGIRTENLEQLMARDVEKVVRLAVRRIRTEDAGDSHMPHIDERLQVEVGDEA